MFQELKESIVEFPPFFHFFGCRADDCFQYVQHVLTYTYCTWFVQNPTSFFFMPNLLCCW